MKPIMCNHEQAITIALDTIALQGNLFLPKNSNALIIFAHGSGSGRLSPRNRHVAKQLNQANFGTLLFDLLTAEEEIIDNVTAELRFDIPLLAKRLVAVTDWICHQSLLKNYPIGYFGASTGAAAALIAADERANIIKAVVSRGGRPDLAGNALPHVKAPSLLIVGGLDFTVIELNQQAQHRMSQAITKLEIVPGATHLFEEPGTLDQVTQLAESWFKQYLI